MLNFPKRLVINGTEWNNNPLKFDVNCIQCNGSTPSWQDIILSGNTALTLVNAKANGLNYVKLFGACEQNGTPSPDTPVDIVSNNGALKYGVIGKNLLDMDASNIVLGKYIDSTGVIRDNSFNFYNNKYIPVIGGQTYTWSTSSVAGYVSVMEYDSTKTFIKRTLFSNGTTTLSSQITLENNTAFVLIGANIDSSTITISKIQAINWQFELGNTATPYEPYHFGIHTDGTVETVNVHGKNLFDVNTMLVENKAIRAGNTSDVYPLGSETNNNSWDCTDYISVLPDTTYTYTIPKSVSAGGAGMVFYSDKSVDGAISGITQDASLTKTFTTPPNCQYVRFSWRKDNANVVQLELGDTATEYEPYFNGGTATAEMLLSVGDYQDEQEVLTGAITRNVGVVVLDGTENWVWSTAKYAYLTISDAALATNIYNNIICTHLDNTSSAWASGSGIRWNSLNTNIILAKKNDISSVDDWKQWLADQYATGTPVTVVYPLTEPTTETVAGQALTTQAGTNIVEITQASINNLALEVSYKGKQ